jgi:hypothetical protein
MLMTEEFKKLTQKEKLLKKLAEIEKKEKDAAIKAKAEHQKKQRADRLRSARIVGEFFLDGGFLDLGALINNRGDRLDAVLKSESDREHMGFAPLAPPVL